MHKPATVSQLDSQSSAFDNNQASPSKLRRRRTTTTTTTSAADRLARQIQAELKECTRARNLARGMEIHSQADHCGLSSNEFVVTSLINMYAKCGRMVDAKQAFDTLIHRDAVSWTALILGYVDNGHCELALELFDGLEEQSQSGFVPDSRIYVAALTACADLAEKSSDSFGGKIRWLEKGRDVFWRAVKNGCSDVYVESSAIDLYSRCGRMIDARKVFDSMRLRNVVSWTVLIQGYVANGECELALEIFDSMEEVPDARTFVAAITACAALAADEDWKFGKSSRWLERGKQVHNLAVTRNCCNFYVENALVDMYGKCRSMIEARRVFDRISRPNVVTWTALLQGYVDNGESELALELFDSMEASRRGCAANHRTYVAAISACTALAAKEIKIKGKDQERIVSSRWLAKAEAVYSQAVLKKCCNVYVENTVVNMFAECGKMTLARNVFEKMVSRDVVSWNSLIQGYVDNDEDEAALKMVVEMDASGVTLNSRTFLAALMACGNLMAVESGKRFHEEICSCGLNQDVVVANCLVDFYGKCGRLGEAKQVFDSIAKKTIVSWTALMCGYGLHGDSGGVLELFEEMKKQGFEPDAVTFVCVLAACSHAGLTNRGKEVFEAMQMEFGIKPSSKHYGCMVDLLGRASELDEEVMKFVRGLAMEADAVTWTAVLGACLKSRNAGVGKVAYERLVELDGGRHGIAYVLMGGIYRSV